MSINALEREVPVGGGVDVVVGPTVVVSGCGSCCSGGVPVALERTFN